jgi:hypothetical protein
MVNPPRQVGVDSGTGVAAEPVDSTVNATAAPRRRSGLGVASLVVAVAFVCFFHGLLQYIPLFIPPFGLVLASTEGSHALLWTELAGMVVALILGAAAIMLRRGRGHGIAAVIIAVSVGTSFVPYLIQLGARR